MSGTVPGLAYETVWAILTGGTDTVLTVADTGFSSVLVTEIRATDDGGAAQTLEVKFTRSAVDYIIWPTGSAIPANDIFVEEFSPLVLKTGDVVKATASAAGVHLSITYAGQARR